MARGWESKAVEQQQELSAIPENPKQELTSEQVTARHRRDKLLLERAQVVHQLEVSQNPRYREMLQRALADLERRLAAC